MLCLPISARVVEHRQGPGRWTPTMDAPKRKSAAFTARRAWARNSRRGHNSRKRSWALGTGMGRKSPRPPKLRVRMGSSGRALSSLFPASLPRPSHKTVLGRGGAALVGRLFNVFLLKMFHSCCELGIPHGTHCFHNLNYLIRNSAVSH